MSPYRTTPAPAPDNLDADVKRFAARSERARRSRRTRGLGALAVLISASFGPLAVAHRHVPEVRVSVAPRLLPTVHALVRRPCPAMDDAERVEYEQTRYVECMDGCVWYPERSSWR
jgi:hypothetical protein